MLDGDLALLPGLIHKSAEPLPDFDDPSFGELLRSGGQAAPGEDAT